MAVVRLLIIKILVSVKFKILEDFTRPNLLLHIPLILLGLLFLRRRGGIGNPGLNIVDVLEHLVVKLVYLILEETPDLLTCQVYSVLVLDLPLLDLVEILDEVEDPFV